MRPRHVLTLTLLAAIPVVLALALTGGGGGTVPGGARLAQLSFELVGGSKAATVVACGNTHHYQAYSAQATIAFDGTISPPGKWSVAVKLKACYGGAFRSSGSIPAKVSSNGSFSGSFPAPIGGSYFARAELKRGGAQVTRSAKRYFEVR